MVGDVTVALDGVSQAVRALQRVGPVLARKAILKSTSAGARHLVKEAKARALVAFRQRTGAVRRNIVQVKAKKPSELIGTYVLGVRHIAGAGVDQFGGILNTVRRRGVRSGRARALKRIRMTRQMKKLIAEAAGFLRSGAEQIGGESGRSLAKRGMNPYYFRFLEFWTKHIGKRAFLEPALVHGGAQGLDVMREVLVRSLDQVAREARA